MRPISIERIDDRTFTVVVGDADGTLSTTCRIRRHDMGKHEPIEVGQFDSDEFQRALMLGEIDAREVMQAVSAVRPR